jgi:hypothetical protein
MESPVPIIFEGISAERQRADSESHRPLTFRSNSSAGRQSLNSFASSNLLFFKDRLLNDNQLHNLQFADSLKPKKDLRSTEDRLAEKCTFKPRLNNKARFRNVEPRLLSHYDDKIPEGEIDYFTTGEKAMLKA